MIWSENGKKEKMGFNKYQKRASRKTGFWSSPFCTECDSFWITTLCLLFGGDSVSVRWRRWFVFFIMIDTLYVYHRPVFSPKKMTLNATLPFYLVMLLFLSSPKIKICDDLHTLYISLDNAWMATVVRTPFLLLVFSVQRHSVSPRQLLCLPFTVPFSIWANGLLRHL